MLSNNVNQKSSILEDNNLQRQALQSWIKTNIGLILSTRNIDYNSQERKNWLEEIRRKCKKDIENSKIDPTKMDIAYNI